MQPIWMGMLNETGGYPMPFMVEPELVVTQGFNGVVDDTLAVTYVRYERQNGEVYRMCDLVYRIHEIEDIDLVVLDMEHWYIFLSREDFEKRRAAAKPVSPQVKHIASTRVTA